MTATLAPPRVGVLLREWRRRRRRSQLDLAVSAGVSARHLSFVETGRARPSRQLTATADGQLIALRDELRGYPGVGSPAQAADLASRLFVPLVIRHRGREQRFISTVTTFGTARDITVAELSVESFYPA